MRQVATQMRTEGDVSSKFDNPAPVTQPLQYPVWREGPPPPRPPRPPTPNISFPSFKPSLDAPPNPPPHPLQSKPTFISSEGTLTPPASPTRPQLIIEPEPLTPRKPPPTSSAAHAEVWANSDGNKSQGAGALYGGDWPRAPFPQPNFGRLPQRGPTIHLSDPRPFFIDSAIRSSTLGHAAFPRPSLGRTLADHATIDLRIGDSHLPSRRPSTLMPTLPPSSARRTPRPPGLTLVRTTSTPIYPGSAFPFRLSLIGVHPSSASPVHVRLTFSGLSSITSSSPPAASPNDDVRQHQLFRLSDVVPLSSSRWEGSITVPLASQCLTCGHTSESLPWTFEHRDEATGKEYRTEYKLVAQVGEEEAALAINVMPDRPAMRIPVGGEWVQLEMDEAVAVAEAKGGLRGMKLDGLQFAYKLLDPSPPLAPSLTVASDCPLLLEATLRFSFADPSSPASSVDRLLAALSPSHTVVSIISVVLPGRSTPIPIGGSWSSREEAAKGYFHVEARSAKNATEVIVKVRFKLVPKFVVFASVASCAGFAVGFRLRLTLGAPSPSAGSSTPAESLHLDLPFFPPPATSSTPIARPSSQSGFQTHVAFPLAASPAPRRSGGRLRRWVAMGWKEVRRVFGAPPEGRIDGRERK